MRCFVAMNAGLCGWYLWRTRSMCRNFAHNVVGKSVGNNGVGMWRCASLCTGVAANIGFDNNAARGAMPQPAVAAARMGVDKLPLQLHIGCYLHPISVRGAGPRVPRGKVVQQACIRSQLLFL